MTATEEKKTKAGNYFVSNYPPFAYWEREQVGAVQEILKEASEEAPPLGIYLHIPFCRKRCHFCYFRVYTDKNAAEINRYIEAAKLEIARYAQTPYLKGRAPKFVYFGGGTPSYLSVNQLNELVDCLKEHFPWDEVEEITFECEPGTLNDKKLAAIKEMGVTRLSLGVENFNDDILATNGRAHRSPEIDKAYDKAKELGFQQINIDLIAGMINETPENWKTCVQEAIKRAPDCVTIYQMEIPYNTTIYKRMEEEGEVHAPVADWETKRKWVSEAFDAFQEAGYEVSSAYTVVNKEKKVRFHYRDALWEGADLLPIGVASFGHLGGMHLQNNADVDPYMEMVNGGEFPIYRSYALSEDEKFLREFILKLKLGSLRPAYYKEKFGKDVIAEFSSLFERFKTEGFVERYDEDEVVLTREGLLQVDKLLHEFFMPQHQGDRYT